MSKPVEHVAPRVLVVEDEADILEAVVSFLNLEGFQAEGVDSLAAAEQRLQTVHYEVLVIDLGLPDGDGLAWLAARTDLMDKGVIITTARSENMHRTAGIRAGADVYLVKPVQLEELSLTILNLVRRLRPQVDDTWKIIRASWLLQGPSGRTLKLTYSEAALLLEVAGAPGELVPRRTLIAAMGYDFNAYDPRRMEILVRRLRSKCKVALNVSLPLETVHGQGYSFVAPVKVV